MTISTRILRIILITLSALISGISYSSPVISVDSLRNDLCIDVKSEKCGDIAKDSLAIADSVAFASMPWYKQLWENGFMIHDPRINYPKFPRFV